MKCCSDLRGQFSNIYASFSLCTAGRSSGEVSSVSHRDVVMPTPGLLRTGLKPEQQALVLRGSFPLVAPGREKMQGKKKNNKKPQLCSKSLSLSGVGTTQCWHKEDPLSFCLGSCLIFWSAGGKSITATEPLLCRGMRAPHPHWSL